MVGVARNEEGGSERGRWRRAMAHDSTPDCDSTKGNSPRMFQGQPRMTCLPEGWSSAICSRLSSACMAPYTLSASIIILGELDAVTFGVGG